jgi:hypothetical protein
MPGQVETGLGAVCGTGGHQRRAHHLQQGQARVCELFMCQHPPEFVFVLFSLTQVPMDKLTI